MQTLGPLCNYYQGVVDKKNQSTDENTRTCIPASTGVSILISPLVSTNEEGAEDTELMGFEDITVEELDAKFYRLQLTPLILKT